MQHYSSHSIGMRGIIVSFLLSFILTTDSFRSAYLRPTLSAVRSSNVALHVTNTPISETPRSVYNSPVPGSIMTLSRFMIEATRSNPDHADFESLMASIQIACKTIANLVSRAGISDLTGLQSSTGFNPGEQEDGLYLNLTVDNRK